MVRRSSPKIDWYKVVSQYLLALANSSAHEFRMESTQSAYIQCCVGLPSVGLSQSQSIGANRNKGRPIHLTQSRPVSFSSRDSLPKVAMTSPEKKSSANLEASKMYDTVKLLLCEQLVDSLSACTSEYSKNWLLNSDMLER